jgi:hypothetical protein
MHTENPGNPVATPAPSHDDLHHVKDADHPGYETTDVQVGGVVVFLGGLIVFVFVFFIFCFGMGKLINTTFATQDGKADKWHKSNNMFAGAAANGGQREYLASTTEMGQKELDQMAKAFPSPQLDVDDGNQATADLHAKEDLLLDHYSKAPGEAGVRIPIERAMEIIAEKGLPVAPAVTTTQLAEAKKPEVQVPLTTGFARTGYEWATIESREQKMSYVKAVGAEK